MQQLIYKEEGTLTLPKNGLCWNIEAILKAAVLKRGMLIAEPNQL